MVQLSVQEEPGLGELGEGVVYGAHGSPRGRRQCAYRTSRQFRVGQQREGHPVAGTVQCQGSCGPSR